MIILQWKHRAAHNILLVKQEPPPKVNPQRDHGLWRPQARAEETSKNEWDTEEKSEKQI